MDGIRRPYLEEGYVEVATAFLISPACASVFQKSPSHFAHGVSGFISRSHAEKYSCFIQSDELCGFISWYMVSERREVQNCGSNGAGGNKCRSKNSCRCGSEKLEQ